uniref:Serine/arginine repetitive matrix protein 1 n=1 Tax=Schistosoma haematobium TaxID=6185 RepID=A0A095C979_SCHHA
MSKINLESIRPWIVKRITELLNFEDEVVCDYIFNQLEERHPDPKEIQINITGFLNSKNARVFLSELWDLLLSAMQTPDGVPAAFLEAKKEEIAKRQEDEKFVLEMRKRENELIQKGTNRTSNMSSEQIDNQKRVSSVKSNGVAESEEPETFTNRNRSTSRTASPAPQPPATTTESREKLDGATSRTAHRDETSSSRSPEQHRRRRHHHHSPERCPVDTRRRRSHSRTRHRRQRSKSRSKLVQKPKSPVTDWRKDLMAGRRRSPPEMPESSYYGNEKRSKGHKHSKKHDKQRHGNSHSHKSHKRSPSHNADYYRPRKHTHNSGSRHHNIVEVNERDQRSGCLEQSRKDGFAENYRKYEGPDLPSHYDYRSSSRYRHDTESHGRNASPEPSRARDSAREKI